MLGRLSRTAALPWASHLRSQINRSDRSTLLYFGIRISDVAEHEGTGWKSFTVRAQSVEELNQVRA